MKKLLSFLTLMIISMMSFAQWSALNHSQLAGYGERTDKLFTGTALIVGTKGGIYRSADNGLTWQRSNNGLDTADIYVRNLTYAQNTVWANVSGSMYASADDGLTWSEVPFTGIYPDGYVNEIASKGNRVFMNYNFHDNSNYYSIICYTDDGLQWSYGDTLNNNTHYWWDIFPDNDYALFYTDQHEQHLFYSYDGIVRDTFPFDGLPSGADARRRHFSIDSSGTTFLYTYDDEIYKYNFVMQEWEQKNTGITSNFIFNAYTLGDVAFAIVYDATVPPPAFPVQIYRSLDSANTWTHVPNPGIAIPIFEGPMVKAANGRIFGNAMFEDSYYTDDNGLSWTKNTELQAMNYNRIVVMDNGDLLTVRHGYGILKSSDNGATWVPHNGNLPEMMGFWYLTEDIFYDGLNTYYAISPQDPYGNFLLYKSTDAQNWTHVSNAPDSVDITYLGQAGNRILLYFEDDGGTYQFSDDQGDTWHNMSPAIDALGLTFLWGFAGNNDTIFLFGESGSGDNTVYMSVNNGNTFVQANSGLPSSGTDFIILNQWGWEFHPSIVASYGQNNQELTMPVIDRNVFPHEIRFYRYNPATSAWSELSSNGIVVPHNVKGGPLKYKDGLWYFATSIGVFVSTDDALTWEKIWDNQGLQLGMQINDVSVSSDFIFLTTLGAGIWHTQVTTPAITTKPVTNITGTQATSGGIVTSTGGMPFVKKGVCFATHTMPDLSDDYVDAGASFTSFDAVMQNLIPGDTYYVRAFIVTPSDTVYGNELSFTTTLPVSAQINPTSADYGLTNPADVFTTITWNDASSITGIVDDNMHNLTATDYNLSGNELWITQSYLSGVLLSDGQTVTLTINFDSGDPATFVITAQQTAIVHAVVNPTSGIFDITYQNDVNTVITWNDANNVTGIVDDNMYNLMATDFDVTVDTLTIFGTYLLTVLNNAGDTITLTVDFDNGNPVVFYVIASETISAELTPDAADFILNVPEDVKTIVTWNDALYITSITDDQTTPYTLTTSDYNVNADTLTIYETYLSSVLHNDSDVVVLTVNFDNGLAQTFTITAITAVGVQKTIGEMKVNVYPNPAKDKIYIAASLKSFELEIYCITGRKLYAHNYRNTAGVVSIDVSNLSQGMYFIVIRNQDFQSVEKIIIAD